MLRLPCGDSGYERARGCGRRAFQDPLTWMDPIHSRSLLCAITLVCALARALAVKPGQELNPNGLSERGALHPERSRQATRLSVSAARDRRERLIMESGSAKGKKAATLTDFGVKDPCTADFDGDLGGRRTEGQVEGARHHRSVRGVGRGLLLRYNALRSDRRVHPEHDLLRGRGSRRRVPEL